MQLPCITIVGRPNVGKSSLMNMLARAKVSIVDPTPGVTRDRVTTVIELQGPLKTETPKLAELVDTGGYGVYMTEDGRFDDAGEDLQKLTGRIEQQIGTAVDQADLILFVVDAQAGVTPLDETVARLLREHAIGKDKSHHPLIRVVANKVDAENWEPYAAEASSLGFGEPLLVSAKTSYLRRDFSERLFELIPETGMAREETGGMRVALVGRRNAGKSSFINALAGEERCIVSEIAGTTRDAVDVRMEANGRVWTAIDTAGVRKRAKLADAVEWWALQRSLASITRADVVLLLVDATTDVTGIEKRLSQRIAEEFRPCVIVVTKWDLARNRKNRKGQPIGTEDYRAYLAKELRGLDTAPIVFSSSKEGIGVRESIGIAFELHEQSLQRVGTGELNRTLKKILSDRGPSSKLGLHAKIYFTTQVAVNPPTIVLHVNKPELFEEQYQRYIINRLREELPFPEVPIRLIFRARSRATLDELISGAHRRKREGNGNADELSPEDIEFLLESADDMQFP